MKDKTIRIFYHWGDIDSIPVDSVANRWCVDDGLFIIDTTDGEPIFIGNMNTITCIKVENSDSENFPKNKKGLVDSDLRISAAIMREEYRNNPEFRQSIYDSIASVMCSCPFDMSTADVIHKVADTLFDYEADSNN